MGNLVSVPLVAFALVRALATTRAGWRNTDAVMGILLGPTLALFGAAALFGVLTPAGYAMLTVLCAADWAYAKMSEIDAVSSRIDAGEPLVVVLEGSIGAGKSTLLRAVAAEVRARGLPALVVDEPVDEWRESGWLGKFYAGLGTAGEAETTTLFQTNVFVTRVAACNRAAEGLRDGAVVLMERSIMTDKHVFMAIQKEKMGPLYAELYGRVWREWARLIPFDLRRATYVYVGASVDRCASNIAARGREGEGAVSADYLRALEAAHARYMASMRQAGARVVEFTASPPGSPQVDSGSAEYADLVRGLVDSILR